MKRTLAARAVLVYCLALASINPIGCTPVSVQRDPEPRPRAVPTARIDSAPEAEPAAAIAAAPQPAENVAPAAQPPAPAPATAEPTLDVLLDSSTGPKREASKKKLAEAGALDGLGTQGAGMDLQMRASGRTRQALRVSRPAAIAPMQQPPAEFNTEAYAHRADNAFVQVADSPLSTFSVDVDTASYSNVRRFLQEGARPPKDAVRIEELVNYFRYDYPASSGADPFAVYTEVANAPWSPRHRLVHIGLRAREIERAAVPARNLVFLIDVSGSMHSADKLPLLKRGLGLLANDLRREDRVALVVYAGSSGLVLPSTPGSDKARILDALGRLEAGGSTNGADGIELAYRVAQENFVRGGINRVVLATDGDFNVGVTSEGDLTRLIEAKRKSGVFLSVLGFGTGNLKDATMELLADKGNGNYAYIDSMAEAHKVLVREAGSTLVTVAKDVKLQIEWNPALVASYRLIGYENRLLADRDFNDDKKDAGEVGAGHTVTALYEVELARGSAAAQPAVDPLKYQSGRALTSAAQSGELLTLKIRYKQPDAEQSQLRSHVVLDRGARVEQSSDDFRWAAAVAGFGMLLRGGAPQAEVSFGMVRALARSAMGEDRHGDRRELLQLIDRASSLGEGG